MHSDTPFSRLTTSSRLPPLPLLRETQRQRRQVNVPGPASPQGETEEGTMEGAAGVCGMEGCEPPAMLCRRRSGVWSRDSPSCHPIVQEHSAAGECTRPAAMERFCFFFAGFSLWYFLGQRIFDLGKFTQMLRFQFYL